VLNKSGLLSVYTIDVSLQWKQELSSNTQHVKMVAKSSQCSLIILETQDLVLL
jgi:hypothetical protein